MSKQKELVELIKSISGQANVLSIPRMYIDLTGGDVKAALLLSQCVYWSDKSKDPEGWFYKSYKEWYVEIGLSQFEVGRAVKKLSAWLKLKKKHANRAPTLHYKVDLDALTKSIIKFLDNRKSQQSDYEETQQSHYEETSQSLTETTADPKTTAETTTAPRPAPRPRDPLFDAIVEVCQVDLTLKGTGTKVGKVRAVLAGASPPYTPEEVYAFRDRWWAWEERESPPTVWKLQDSISSVRSKNGRSGKLSEPKSYAALRRLAAKKGLNNGE